MGVITMPEKPQAPLVARLTSIFRAAKCLSGEEMIGVQSDHLLQLPDRTV